MSHLSDFCNTIRAWLDDEDPSDALVESWVRDAEERMNNELRVTEMVRREQATFDDNCAVLPPDWLEHIYVRAGGGAPFHFCTNDAYWQLQDPPSYAQQPDPTGGEVYPWPGQKMHYTTIGNTLFVWPPIDPEALTKIEIAYYKKITPLGDSKDVVFDRYPAIYRNTTLTSAAPYLVEDDRLNTWAGLATAGITKANEASKKARHSGSPIAPRIRSFG